MGAALYTVSPSASVHVVHKCDAVRQKSTRSSCKRNNATSVLFCTCCLLDIWLKHTGNPIFRITDLRREDGGHVFELVASVRHDGLQHAELKTRPRDELTRQWIIKSKTWVSHMQNLKFQLNLSPR